MGYNVIFFGAFVIVMTIIMMNLITGLALDDIQKIRENAEFQNLSMQATIKYSRTFIKISIKARVKSGSHKNSHYH